MYKNLREYIAALERAGELQHISVRVDPVYEIAEITDRIAKSEGGGKALMFDATGTNFPVVTNLFGSDKRIAMALGVESLDEISERIECLLHQAVAPKTSLMEKLRMLPLLGEMSHWLPVRQSSRGECQQVVLLDNDARLSRLPILKSWGCDGGRFITLPMVNTVDPESGVSNVGMYRMQIFDDRTTGMHWHVHKTGARHYDAYRRAGKMMPVSVALGGDPVYTYAATAPMPDNMDEYLLAGFLRRKPVKLVKCLTNDIYVPADCDFIIEGFVNPQEPKVIEGAFGDHTGFYSLTDLYPQFHVTAITHRRDAIYPATIVGVPPQEDAYIARATEKIFLAPIRLAVQPEVTDLTMPTSGTAHNIAIVAIDKRYDGQAVKVAQSLWGAGQMMFNKYMVITRADVDIRDSAQLSAIARRIELRCNVIFSEGILDVLDHATATQGYGGKMLIDATDVDINSAVENIDEPRTFTPCGGVRLVNTEFLHTFSTVVLYADEGHPDTVDIEEYLTTNNLQGMNFAVLFDYAASASMRGEELLWLAAANTDPRRDVHLWGRTLIVDARSKRPSINGNPARFPNVVTSLTQTIHDVSGRWNDYGLGEFIESPSRRYRKLWLSDKADW